jgi:ATP-dependent DNA helicase RecQ
MTGQMFGAAYLVDVLRGSQSQRVLQRHHDRLPVYGAGKEQPAAYWRDLIEQFIRQGLVEQDMEHGSLHLTDGARQALDGAQVFVTQQKQRPQSAPAAAGYDAALFESLRELRRQIAAEHDVPPYVVFSDRSLVEMATHLPQSQAGFLTIHGVGERKLAQYGERFLDLIRTYCAEQGREEQVGPVEEESPHPGLKPRAKQVGELFAAGYSVEEIQDMYGVKRSRVMLHLYHCAQAGHKLPPERVLALSRLEPAERDRVLNLMAELGAERLRPIYDALGETIAFDELWIMRVYRLCLAPV